MIKRKLKVCAYCSQELPVFKNTENGPQCQNCYGKEYAKKQFLKKSVKHDFKMSNRQRKKEIKKQEREALIAKLDKKFSLLVRWRASVGGPSNRRVACYTCGFIDSVAVMQCGHFIPRAHMLTRYLLDNCRPQCRQCNEGKGGNLEVFEENLEREIPGIVEKLQLLKHKVVHYSSSDLQEIDAYLQKQLKFVVNR